MRVVIVENTDENLKALRDCIHALLPNALVKGFTNGNDAEIWCNNHSAEIDLYFGNWWGTLEEYDTPEGSAVWKYINWEKKPLVICVGDEVQFSRWSIADGADAFIMRPITIENLRDLLEKFDF